MITPPNLTTHPSQTYADYVRLQQTTFCSLESANKHWLNGQKRYIHTNFINTPKDSTIIDIACGDGVGLSTFKNLNFQNISGVEFNPKKVKLARNYGYPVHQLDMHHLHTLTNHSFDIVYSSHTLEHAYDPILVVSEIHRILKPNGVFFLVLPYPDQANFSAQAHLARQTLGTNIDDSGHSVTKFFTSHGFELISQRFDSFREPEIWLKLTPSAVT